MICILGGDQIELPHHRKDPTDMNSGKLTDTQRELRTTMLSDSGASAKKDQGSNFLTRHPKLSI